MEIACIPEKSDLVLNFMYANDIEILPGINPFWEQSVEETDQSPEATSYRIAHFTRVLLAWWEAASFVQSKDTSTYYQRLITNAVKDPGALHACPKGVIGISIDARGVNDPKDNPDINFDYEEGFEPPQLGNHKNNTRPQLRSFATGGTVASLPAPKTPASIPSNSSKHCIDTCTQSNRRTGNPPPPSQHGAQSTPKAPHNPTTDRFSLVHDSPAFATPHPHTEKSPAGHMSQYFTSPTKQQYASRSAPNNPRPHPGLSIGRANYNPMNLSV